MPRMMSVTVWVPAMPPMLATMGMSAASAGDFFDGALEAADHGRGHERR